MYFAFFNGFSGMTIFEANFISGYNMVFTAWPLLVKALLEQDINYTIHGT
tara:strand:+ start:286 stop:435 length:150 start_codon:yes stop_codon:yes gene_type:complete